MIFFTDEGKPDFTGGERFLEQIAYRWDDDTVSHEMQDKMAEMANKVAKEKHPYQFKYHDIKGYFSETRDIGFQKECAGCYSGGTVQRTLTLTLTTRNRRFVG